MARALRIHRAGGQYHVMSRGTERRNIFCDEAGRENFLGRLKELPARFGVEVEGYVLMDNHFHLLLCPRGLNLSRALHWLNAGFCIWFNTRHGRSGPLFQGRYKSVLIGNDGHLHEVSRYIHLNPVRVRKFGLDQRSRRAAEKGAGRRPASRNVKAALEQLENFRWSSFRAYAGLEKKPEWLKASWVGGMTKREYKKYVEDGIRLGMPGNPMAGQIVEGYLGSKEELKELKEELKGRRGEQKALRQVEGLLEWDEIVTAVEGVQGMKWDTLCRLYGNPGRDLALLLGRRHTGLSLAELGRQAGNMKYPAVSEAVKRITEKVREDSDLALKWSRLNKILDI